MSLSYSTLTLDSLHFPCSSHLFPKCNTCLFQSFGQDIPFPGKFSFLETLLKPSPTTPAKKIPPPQRNLWLYNYLLYPFLHMIYVFFLLIFIQFCLLIGLFTQVIVPPTRSWVHGGQRFGSLVFVFAVLDSTPYSVVKEVITVSGSWSLHSSGEERQ